ncbi:MAG: hypothetical protein WBQ17_06330 [Rhizomicrobium sp.]
MAQNFPGTPELYRKIAIVISAGVHVYIYLGFTLIKYLARGENWFHVWQFPAALAVSAIIVAMLHYRWMMRLDAQYGKGSGWTFKEVRVKLPELRYRA